MLDWELNNQSTVIIRSKTYKTITIWDKNYYPKNSNHGIILVTHTTTTTTLITSLYYLYLKWWQWQKVLIMPIALISLDNRQKLMPKLTRFNDDTNRRCSKFTRGQGTIDKISDKREMAKNYEKRFTRQCH